MLKFRLTGMAAFVASCWVLAALPAAGEPYYLGEVRHFVDAHIRPWLTQSALMRDAALCDGVFRTISQPQILEFDQQWIQEAGQGGGPLIDQVLSGPFSATLRGFQADNVGVVTEIFFIGKRGFLCAASQPTSDFWQADEDIWTSVVSTGAKPVNLAAITWDESVMHSQSQVSIAVTDTVNGSLLGVLVVGGNIDAL